MARPIEFDPDAVLHAVTNQFLATGYAGTSVNQLAEVTGLGKQSLYNAFGDKPALFQHALTCVAARGADQLTQLACATTGFTALETFLNGVAADCASRTPARRHCLVSSGLLEGIDDPDIQRSLRGVWTTTRNALRAVIERGQHDRSIRGDLAADALADHLMTAISGLRVAARAQLSSDRLRASAALTLQLFEPRPPPPVG